MGFPIVNGKEKNRFLLNKMGFTLIELLIVMAIIAVLLTLVSPKFFSSIDKSKEAALKHDLSVMRDSIDKYYGDTGKYPASLEDLVKRKYLKQIPIDPMTDSASTWVRVPNPESTEGGLFDIKSGTTKVATDGMPYSQW